jgi:signal transduction histidine kinase
MRRALVVAIASLGLVVGVYSLRVGRDDPAYSFAGASTVGAVALLGAGFLLVGAGLLFWMRRPSSLAGPLLSAAGIAWFLFEWKNPGIGSAAAFTVGLCLYGACPPVVGHAVLVYPRRLTSWLHRAGVAVAYAGNVLVLGVLPAIFYDPTAQGCSQCPRNLVLVSGSERAVTDLHRAGIYLGIAWAASLAVALAVKLVRASRPSRPVLVGGFAYLGLVAAVFAASRSRGFLWNGTLARRLWLGEAAALAGVAVAVGWNAFAARRARSSVARLVLELAQAPPAGGLRDALARIAGDPDLVLAYPLADSGRLVDAEGRGVELPDDGAKTSLVRDGRPVAVLAHKPGLLDDEQLVEEVTVAARLALENERLQAEVRARLAALRASRLRIVATGDSERRRLERDLHDGAQQQLVALSLSLRLLRSQLAADADPEAVQALADAESELVAAVAELRDLARGIFPSVLADGGLAVAVRALAEDGPVPLRIGRLPPGRFTPAVETASYTVVAEVARAATGPVAIEAEERDGLLVVLVEAQVNGELDDQALADRLGALDGRLTVDERDGGQVTIRAELPCGS